MGLPIISSGRWEQRGETHLRIFTLLATSPYRLDQRLEEFLLTNRSGNVKRVGRLPHRWPRDRSFDIKMGTPFEGLGSKRYLCVCSRPSLFFCLWPLLQPVRSAGAVVLMKTTEPSHYLRVRNRELSNVVTAFRRLMTSNRTRDDVWVSAGRHFGRTVSTMCCVRLLFTNAIVRAPRLLREPISELPLT